MGNKIGIMMFGIQSILFSMLKSNMDGSVSSIIIEYGVLVIYILGFVEILILLLMGYMFVLTDDKKRSDSDKTLLNHLDKSLIVLSFVIILLNIFIFII